MACPKEGKARQLSSACHSCALSVALDKRGWGLLLVQELKQLGQRKGSDYKLCRTDAGKWGHTKSPRYTPPSIKMWFSSCWRSSDTTLFEQAVAGPRCKWPRVQIMDHPLPRAGGLRRAQHTHQSPMLSEHKPGSHNLCSPGLGHSCTHSPGAKPCASSACSPTDSQLASAPSSSASLWSSSYSRAETQGSSCFSSMLWLPRRQLE